jgi:hypothetical protein
MYVSPSASTDRGGHVGPSPSQVGPKGGRPAPLWSQISRVLTRTLARRRQTEHLLHKISLAKNHGWPATWWPLNHFLSWKHCRQAEEPPLGHYKYPSTLSTRIHTLYSRLSTCKGSGALVVA